MPIARINKKGIFIAKPGRSVDDGPNYQFFSPDFPTQTVYLSGTATSFVDYADAFGPSAWRTFYKTATIGFGKTFARPPLVYVQAIGPNGKATVPAISELRFDGTTRGNYPRVFGQVSTTSLIIFVNRANYTYARYYIMENTLP